MAELFEAGRPRVAAALGLCLWVIGSRQDFDTGEGIVVWPRDGDAETWAPSAKDILDRTAAKVSEILSWQRQGAPGAGPLDYKGVKAVPFSPDQLRALEGLADKGVDVPYLFGTLGWSTVMLAAQLHMYRAIEAWRRDWKGLINKEKRGLIAVRRAHLKYWKDRLRPAAMGKLEEAFANVDEVLASLNRFAYPSRKTLRALKGRLHVRGSRLALPTEFISWTVRELVPRLGEREASTAAARLVKIAVPHVKQLSPQAVYSHFYRSL